MVYGEGGGGGAWMSRLVYVSVVQAVLIYGLDTWVMSPHIGNTLGRFHHRLVCRLTGRNLRRRTDGTWVYPPLTEAMAETVL